jgi:hypothetical protein
MLGNDIEIGGRRVIVGRPFGVFGSCADGAPHADSQSALGFLAV